jgi:hypothetical protein
MGRKWSKKRQKSMLNLTAKICPKTMFKIDGYILIYHYPICQENLSRPNLHMNHFLKILTITNLIKYKFSKMVTG